MTRYVLPDLPYDYGALEPHISARIMELHHDKHHRAYVNAANRAIEMLEEARGSEDFSRIAAMEKALAFNASGHVLHSLYWQNLSPDGGGQPTGELARAIDQSFGGFDGLKKQMTQAGATIMGSGWAALVWDTLSGRLLTVQIHDHQSETIQGSVPLFVIDAWEHAYYLQYQNDKAKFLEAVWNVVNWQDIAQRYETARHFTLNLKQVAEMDTGNGERPGGGTPRKSSTRGQSQAGRA